MRYLWAVLFFCISIGVFAQKKQQKEVVDGLRYLEDQFYMGITYNLLLNKPMGVTQRGFSYGLSMGFIKDIPLNKERNVGLGVGFGYGLNSYYSNLLATESNGANLYTVLGNTEDYNRNKIETHILELPIEFRWRDSNAADYKFWRVYTGIKLGYVFSRQSKFVSDKRDISFSNDDIRKFQYGATFSFGYNTWNFYIYYPLTTLFNDDLKFENRELSRVKSIKIGVIFYIL